MSDELIKIVSSQGIWSLLSFLLIYYILREQRARDERQELREEKYQEIIDKLTVKFEVISSDVKEIKNKLEI